MAQKIGGKRGRPAKTPKKGRWRPTPPDGKSLKDVAGTVEDLKWCCDLVRDEKLKSTVTVVRKTCGDSGLSGGKEGAETARGSGVLTLRDPVAVCGLRGDDSVWADCACRGETTITSRLAPRR